MPRSDKSFAAHVTLVERLAAINSCGTICEKSRLRDVMYLDGQLLCCVGSCGSGAGAIYASTYDVVPRKGWKGKKPLPYSKFGLNPNDGYESMLVTWRGKEYVLTNERRFLTDKTVKKLPDTRTPEERVFKTKKEVIDLW